VGSSLQALSVHTGPSGYPVAGEDRFTTTFESPLGERWGGWYVTGTHGEDFHMGNVVSTVTAQGPYLDRKQGANVQSLDRFLNTKSYLAGSSDIVALMVLEHQYVMENTLTETGQAVRRVLAREAPGDAYYTPEYTKRVLHKYARKITALLLFSGEYELKHEVTGAAAFQEAFHQDCRKAGDGTSLKDFDLHHRLFKYRCSYMIYSALFQALPAPLKQAVYGQLGDVLTGKDTSPEYAHLEPEERAHIQKILSETLPEIRTAWQSSVTP
jgi:hypothetical protein